MAVAVDYKDLKNAELFKNLSDEALIALAKRARYLELAADEMLFHQGDPSDALYLLLDGQVHIVRRYENGEEVVLATEGPYYVIGELSMLVGQPRTGGVLAVSDCTLIALDRDDFMEVHKHVPGVASQVLAHVGQRLYRMNLLVRENAIGNVAARVASVLLLLSGGIAGPIAREIRVSRVARSVAIEADVVDRLFQEWIRKGYIEFDGRKVIIHNIEALHNIAG